MVKPSDTHANTKTSYLYISITTEMLKDTFYNLKKIKCVAKLRTFKCKFIILFFSQKIFKWEVRERERETF